MKKVWIAVLVGLAVGAYAGTQTVASEVQLTNRPAPAAVSDFTTSNSLWLGNNVDYFRVFVCSVDSNDGLQATGSLKAYALDERAARVVRNKQLDLDLSTQEAGKCIQFPDQKVGVPLQYLMYAASGLTLTDGGTFLTQADAGLDGGAFVVHYRGWTVPR